MSQKSWHFKCEKNNIDLPGFMGELLRGGIFTIIFFGVNMPPPPFYRKYAPTSLKQLSTASNNAYHILLRSEPVHCSILIEMSLPKFTMPDRSGILDDWNQSRNSRSTAYPETSLFPYSLIYPGSLSAAQKIWTSLFLPTTAAVYNCTGTNFRSRANLPPKIGFREMINCLCHSYFRSI